METQTEEIKKPVIHTATNNMDENIKKEFQKMLDAQTALVFKEIQEVKTTLAPIAAIYTQAQGFGKGMKFIFKSLVIPLSIVIGLFLSIKAVFSSNK